MKPDMPAQALLDAIDADTMLGQVQGWAAINTGTANLAGLAQMADVLADAFSTLPGEIELVEPATVTAISAEGHEFEKPHGRHMVLRVRPEAERRFVLTGQTAPDGTEAGRRNTVIVFVLERRAEGWVCVAAQNTDVVPGAETQLSSGGKLAPQDYR